MMDKYIYGKIFQIFILYGLKRCLSTQKSFSENWNVTDFNAKIKIKKVYENSQSISGKLYAFLPKLNSSYVVGYDVCFKERSLANLLCSLAGYKSHYAVLSSCLQTNGILFIYYFMLMYLVHIFYFFFFSHSSH